MRRGPISARVIEREPGAADRTILLLHGVASSNAQFDATWDRLARHGDVVVPDLLGFGRSLDRRRRAYSLDDHLDALEWLLPGGVAGESELVIAGHSLGGALGLSLAARHARRARLVAMWGAPLHSDGESARRHVRGTGRLNAVLGLDTALARATCTLLCPRYRISRPLYRLARPELPLPVVHDAVVHSWHSYIGSMRSIVFAATWPAALEQVTAARCDVRIVAGTEDRAVDHPLMERTAAAHPSVQFEQVPGAGHDLPISAPATCVAQLEAWLDVTRAQAWSHASGCAPPRSPQS